MHNTQYIRLLLCGAALIGCYAIAQMVPGNPQMGQSPTVPRTPQMAGSYPNTQIQTRMDDKKFVRDAAIAGMTEVKLGQLAADKGSTDAVRQFGQKMADDHSKANTELKQLASQDNIPVPDSLDSKHQSVVDNLSKLSGPAFDKAYIKDQKKDHERAVQEFQNEANNGSNPDVKGFASKTLPTIQEHLSMTKSLE
jgi:putative membrane protein